MQENHPFSIRIMSLLICLVFAAGCGAGGDDASKQAPEDAVATSQTAGPVVEKAIKATLESLNAGKQAAKNQETLYKTIRFIDIPLRNPKDFLRDGYELSLDFPCGTLTSDEDAITFTFNGSDNCAAIQGAVQYMKSNTEENRGARFQFDQLRYGECTIEGAVDVESISEDGIVETTIIPDGLKICGHPVEGACIVSYSTKDDELSFEITQQSSYDAGNDSIGVITDFNFSSSQGITGNAMVEINEQSLTIGLSGIKLDPDCGLPVAGKLRISDVEGYFVDIPFDENQCSLSELRFIWNNEEIVIDLDSPEKG